METHFGRPATCLVLRRSRYPAGFRHLALAALVAGGCSFAPDPQVPAPVEDLPATFGEAAPAEPATDPLTDPGADPSADPAAADPSTAWWRSFGDPVLDTLVETALAANLDLAEAVSRLEELRHRYRIARAPLSPSLSAETNANRSSSPANIGLGGEFAGDGGAIPGLGFAFPDRFDFTTYSVSASLAYELDFWGRLRNDAGAAAHDFLATRADAETVRITVVGTTISAYLEVVAARTQLALAGSDADLLAERAELTEERYRSGLVTSFELYAIRQQHRTAASNLAGLRTAVEDAEGRLALVLGRFAGTLGSLLPDALAPEIASESAAGLPATLPAALLAQRPDVMAAFQRMEAARLGVGARRAELWPTLSLNGSAGLQSGEPDELFQLDQWFTNLIGGLVAPIFQGGRLRANAQAAAEQYEQAMIGYARAVLGAFREARTSLARLHNERARHAEVLRQVADAQASLDYQLERVRRGVGAYVEYLDARINLNRAETALALAERGVGEARLEVHRALGGTWVAEDIETVREAGEADRTKEDRADEAVPTSETGQASEAESK